MVEAQRALLDELMGTARNLTDEEKKGHRELRWDDREVCGFYLVGFCPHDLFVNTKSDIGPCPRIHDKKLKESFEQSARHDSFVPRFEAELAQFCEKLVQDLDRKVRRGRERIAQDVDMALAVPFPTERAEQLVMIEEKIRKLLEQSESLGEEGKVDEAQALMKKVDILNAEKASVMQQASSERGLVLSQEKKMALCEICGSFLVANDAVERTQSHVTGKQHVGYGMVRDYLADYKARKDKAREKEMDEKRKQEQEAERLKENGRSKEKDDWEWERDRDTERERGRVYLDRGRDRDRDRYRDRDRGRVARERERDWERDKDHDRLRDRDHVRERSHTPLMSSSWSPVSHRGRRRSRSPEHIV